MVPPCALSRGVGVLCPGGFLNVEERSIQKWMQLTPSGKGCYVLFGTGCGYCVGIGFIFVVTTEEGPTD